MKVTLSKKELMRDNIQLNKELNDCVAKNASLYIMYEQMRSEVDEANENIKRVNKKLDKE